MSSRLSHNARMFRKQAGDVCKPFFGTKNMNEKKFRKNFSQNSSGQQNVTFFWGSERRKRNFQVYFMTNSRRETVILEDSFERASKNYSVEKKIHEKNRFEKKVMTIFLKIFFRKKWGGVQTHNSNLLLEIGPKFLVV